MKVAYAMCLPIPQIPQRGAEEHDFRVQQDFYVGTSNLIWLNNWTIYQKLQKLLVKNIHLILR
jgi:hypothetical protein